MKFIMSQQFVDREEELTFLEKVYGRRGAQLIVIYGRRRIGKTELLLQFARNKPHLYFLADKTSIQNNLRRLARRMADYLGKPSFARINFQDWESLFREFIEWKAGGERVIIIIDEFPYLIELSKSVPSEFQVIWDEFLSKREDVMLVLCGSSIGVMKSEVLGYRSPLYGRRTGQWKVREIHPLKVREFVPGYTLEDSFRVYGILGGVPAYLSQLDGSKGLWENVRDLLSKGSPLYEEVDNLLRMELREPKNYKLVLQALAEGKRRVTEIANHTGLDKALVSKYLEVLRTMDLVGYETPLLERPLTKKRRYYILDKYFRFWFRYVQPNREMVEEGRSEDLIKVIRGDFEAYMGFVFEEIVRRLVHRILPFAPVKVGRHWWKERGEAREVDLLALGKGFVALIEVKWSDLGEREVRRILGKLRSFYEELGLDRYGRGVFLVVAKRAPKVELEDAYVRDLTWIEGL